MTEPTEAQLAAARRQHREMAEMLRGIWRDGTFGDVADRVLALLAEERTEIARLTTLMEAQRVAFEQVARERDEAERLAKASAEVERLASMVAIENGFVACRRCGEQESNDDMDFMPELRAALVGLRAVLPPMPPSALTPGAAHAS